MKVAVSIPDDVFEKAEKLSKRLGVSRSGLYARALREIVSRNTDDEITARLNAVCEQLDTRLPEDLRRMQRRSIEPEQW